MRPDRLTAPVAARAPSPTPCPGCGAELPAEQGPTHPYMRSSAACWARFGEVLAKEFGDPAYFSKHQLTVDAYAVQHPGKPERREIQSVGLHLMTLCLVFERGADPAEGPRLHKRMVGRPDFARLAPPSMAGRMTAVDLLAAHDAAEHLRLAEAWASDVWTAYERHHAVVRRWVDFSIG